MEPTTRPHYLPTSDSTRLLHLPLLAADLLEASGWNRGVGDQPGDVVTSRHTASEAIGYAHPSRKDKAADVALALTVLGHTAGIDGAWELERGRTQAEVVDRLRSSELDPTRMTAALGPQWEHIVAMARRAATLTRGEALAIATAEWNPPPRVFNDRRTGPGRDRPPLDWAGLTVGKLAEKRAWSVGAGFGPGWHDWPASRNVAHRARAAAEAVATHDLIGQHEYTQDSYDRQTAAWVAAIGAAHPDDTP